MRIALNPNPRFALTLSFPAAAGLALPAEKVTSLADVPWGEFVRSPPLWSLLAVHCSHGVAPLICLSWMPSYYHQVGP